MLEQRTVSLDTVRDYIDSQVNALEPALWLVNTKIHQTPEQAFNEYIAHEVLTGFIEKQGFCVTRNAYDLPTAFEAVFGQGGRCVNFSAEYDALPIGHACGHNLIAVAAVASFVALANALKHFDVPGRAQILGTPGEEDGGGKIILLDRNAYAKAHVSLMVHPMSEDQPAANGLLGIAGQTSNANIDIVAAFKGKSAHAAANPWDGVNALDALVMSYNSISMLRQHIKPMERMHGCILQAPTITNAIPEDTKVKYSLRSPTMEGLRILEQKVRKCLEAAGLATGCEIIIETDLPYADIRVSNSLCSQFTKEMKHRGIEILEVTKEPMQGSTDMGNVTQVLPGLHATIGIPGAVGASPHNHEFTTAAGSRDAYLRILEAAKSMATTAWLALYDEAFFAQIRDDFNLSLKA